MERTYLEPPVSRIESPEEKGIRIARGILIAKAESARARLEELHAIQGFYRDSVSKLDEAMCEAPQDLIENLSEDERILIDEALKANPGIL